MIIPPTVPFSNAGISAEISRISVDGNESRERTTYRSRGPPISGPRAAPTKPKSETLSPELKDSMDPYPHHHDRDDSPPRHPRRNGTATAQQSPDQYPSYSRNDSYIRSGPRQGSQPYYWNGTASTAIGPLSSISSPSLNPSLLRTSPPLRSGSRGRYRSSSGGEGEDQEDDNSTSARGGGGGGSESDHNPEKHRKKRRIIEKKSRQRRFEALDHLKQVVMNEKQNGGLGGAGGGVESMMTTPRKDYQADVCRDAVGIITRLKGENDGLRNENNDLKRELRHLRNDGSGRDRY